MTKRNRWNHPSGQGAGRQPGRRLSQASADIGWGLADHAPSRRVASRLSVCEQSDATTRAKQLSSSEAGTSISRRDFFAGKPSACRQALDRQIAGSIYVHPHP
jgi:hypothetical protein